MAAAISVSGLTKRYADVVAVDDVSLEVQRGEIYALLGLNGAGKTTLIRMLLGMIRPTAGCARVLGTMVLSNDRSAWSRVGYLVEAPAAYPELTVRENLEVARRLRRLADRQSIDDIIDRLYLTPYADRRARALSMGNLQRLALAKALIHAPELLIVDEPVNGLDPAGVVEIRTLLLDLVRDRGATVFLSSHLLVEVSRLAARIGIIHRGRLLREADPATLHAQVRRRLHVRTRDDQAAPVVLASHGFTPVLAGDRLVLTDERAVNHPDEVATVLVQAGCPPTGLVVEEEDLEEFFLRMVGAVDE